MRSASHFAAGDARLVALTVLLRLGTQDMVQAVLDRALRESHLDRRDASLATELVYGYLRTELRLNYILSLLLSRPGKLPSEMLLALGLAAYAMLFLERIPSHATVDWTVRHIRERFGVRLGGVANGVLRTLERLGDSPLHRGYYRLFTHSPEEMAAVFYAMPVGIVRLWQDAYGLDAAEQLLVRSFNPPWPGLRCNAKHPRHDALLAAALECGGIEVGGHGVAFSPGNTPDKLLERSMVEWHAEGALSWQAAGSQEALRQAGVWGGNVWDVCAGQGGKTLALMEQDVDVRLCTDMHRSRLRLLQRTALRLGFSPPACVRASAVHPPLRAWCGDILLDVPCSGLGTLSRRPEIRRRRDVASMQTLAALQRAILESAWEILVPGSSLIYMTCTLNPMENEQQIAHFLESHASAHCEVQWQTPHEHPWMEGMYVARVRKV